jgi:2-keto-4-pentenoate hydratase/2-oxohepta-3-ene-1,7-dioic acid hydratase in catechol pathway
MKFYMLVIGLMLASTANAEVRQIARFQHDKIISYGEIKGSLIQPIIGEPFNELVPNGKAIPLTEVELLLPTTPQKVFAVGMNFDSHIASPSNAAPPLFLKLPTSLIRSGEDVQLPKDASNVHFEGELVLVIGKQAKNIAQADAESVIFGVIAGNDLTERNWQSSDLQWMRSKASDGFGPISSVITVGVDYNNLLLTTTLNGKIVQQENTKYMIHKPAKVVSYLSQYFTLMPGDLIFMGTPGRTQSLHHGDIVSVTIDQVGTVENQIRQ